MGKRVMTRIKNYLLLPVAAISLVGCVSSSDFSAMQSRVIQLNAKVNSLETRLTGLQEALVKVKGQRVVRLPTGAPTEVRPRMTVPNPLNSNNIADNALSTNLSATQSLSSQTLSNQQLRGQAQGNGSSLLNKILNLYHQGDVENAVVQLNHFLRQNRDPVYRKQALFYLGEANYALRQYAVAEQALEALVFQSGEMPSGKAVNLLKQVYQIQGKRNKIKSLTNFINQVRMPKVESINLG